MRQYHWTKQKTKKRRGKSIRNLLCYRLSMGLKAIDLALKYRYPTNTDKPKETTDKRRAKALAASHESPEADFESAELPEEISNGTQSQPTV